MACLGYGRECSWAWSGCGKHSATVGHKGQRYVYIDDESEDESKDEGDSAPVVSNWASCILAFEVGLRLQVWQGMVIVKPNHEP